MMSVSQSYCHFIFIAKSLYLFGYRAFRKLFLDVYISIGLKYSHRNKQEYDAQYRVCIVCIVTNNIKIQRIQEYIHSKDYNSEIQT